METQKQEKRTLKLNLRANGEDPESRTVEGYAALFGSESEELWGFYEVIEPDAFVDADMSDVRALFNHDPNMILARSSSGTLKLEIDDKGLLYRFDMPKTTLGNDLLTSIRRGDINQSSFAFTIKEDSWEYREGNQLPLRHIRKIEAVYDIAPVTYPAYAATSATARSLEGFQEKDQINYDHEALFAEVDILQIT